MKYVYETTGSCSKVIEVEITGEHIITGVNFVKSCPGNTSGIVKLITGMRAEEVIEKLKGTDCSGQGTSCPDQLSLALAGALEILNS